MRKSDVLRNQSGFTITNVVVGMGLGAIVLAGLGAALTMTFSASRNIDQKTAAMTFVDLVARSLAKPTTCERAMADAGALPVLDIAGGTVTLANISGNSIGSQLGNKLELEEIAMVKNMAVPTTVAAHTLTSPGGYRRHSAFLHLKVKNTTGPTPVSMRLRSIPMRVITDSTNRIVSCSTETPEAQVCEGGGGLWDPMAIVGEQCRPRGSHCQFGGSFADPAMGIAEGGFNNTYTGDRSCLTGFVRQRSGSMSVMIKTGKYDYTARTYPVWTCLRCQNHATLMGSPGDIVDEYQNQIAQGFADTEAESVTEVDNNIAAQLGRLTGWW